LIVMAIEFYSDFACSILSRERRIKLNQLNHDYLQAKKNARTRWPK
jgi:hypothetical protein